MTYRKLKPPVGAMMIRVGKHAEAVLDIPAATQHAMIHAGELPQPIRLSSRIRIWTPEQMRAHFARLAKEQGIELPDDAATAGGA